MNVFSKIAYMGKHFVRTSEYRRVFIEWVIWKLAGLSEPGVTLAASDGTQAVIRNWHNMSELYFWRNYGIPSLEVTVIERALNRKGSICIDIGANIGIYSLFFAACGASRVYAIEASSSNFTRLQKNLSCNPALSGVVTALKAAASDAPGTLHIQFNAESPGQTGVTPISASSEVSEAIVLDAFCSEHSFEQIDLIKIDVEGFELRVLRGCQKLLEQQRIKLVLFESIEDGLLSHGSSRKDQWNYFNSLGYQIQTLTDQVLDLREYVLSTERDFLALSRTSSLA